MSVIALPASLQAMNLRDLETELLSLAGQRATVIDGVCSSSSRV